ncbi:MAG: HipA N-terminal domain-containing protein, partial [Nocardioidaceae bacterium]|nr:HipA N-terminal domain-containing protein [Nocardioidaceae bacterium]
MRDLYALVGRDLLGVFHETADGAVFEYTDSSRATPLSLSLPRGRASSPEVGINYLDNLLPDRADVRARWARERSLTSSDTFTLTTAYGEDVAGAVTLTPDPERPRTATGPLIEATEDDIASRIASIRHDDTSWIDPRVKPRMSLAGAQGKFSLSRIGDRWYWPTYDRPSTHILKPPPSTTPFRRSCTRTTR